MIEDGVDYFRIVARYDQLVCAGFDSDVEVEAEDVEADLEGAR